MTDARQIQLVVASRSPDGQLRVNMVIEGMTQTFTMARHVAASAVAEISRALAGSGVDSDSAS